MAAAGCRIRRRKNFMKRIITLATVLLVGLASVQAVQTDDQQKKKKKKQAQTTSQTTPAPKTSGTQTTKNRGGTQTSNQYRGTQTPKRPARPPARRQQEATNP